jgi:phosphonate transport system permease protein
VVVVGPDVVREFERGYRAYRRARRGHAMLGGLLFASALVGSMVVGEVSPAKVVEGWPGLVQYVIGTLPATRPGSLASDVAEWYWGLGRWLSLLLDTVLIAFLGTMLGALAAFGLSLPATRTLVRSAALHFAARRVLELARTVPELVYALIFVYAFGLGALPGILAIALHSAGALGKLFAEVTENVDRGPLDGVCAAGGRWVEVVRYAVVPQVLPNFVSYTLLRFEINVRASSVIGFVGAGGIGQELYLVIRQFIYTDISAIVVLLVVTVALIDVGCERLRYRLIGWA